MTVLQTPIGTASIPEAEVDFSASVVKHTAHTHRVVVVEADSEDSEDLEDSEVPEIRKKRMLPSGCCSECTA
jgi:hypothetical protein